jgi:hypothetical protein
MRNSAPRESYNSKHSYNPTAMPSPGIHAHAVSAGKKQTALKPHQNIKAASYQQL